VTKWGKQGRNLVFLLQLTQSKQGRRQPKPPMEPRSRGHQSSSKRPFHYQQSRRRKKKFTIEETTVLVRSVKSNIRTSWNLCQKMYGGPRAGLKDSVFQEKLMFWLISSMWYFVRVSSRLSWLIRDVVGGFGDINLVSGFVSLEWVRIRHSWGKVYRHILSLNGLTSVELLLGGQNLEDIWKLPD
jgi:hypothetical protein